MNRMTVTQQNENSSHFDDQSDIHEMNQKLINDKTDLSFEDQNDIKELLNQGSESVDRFNTVLRQVDTVLNQYLNLFESDNQQLSRSNNLQTYDVHDSFQKVDDKKELCMRSISDIIQKWNQQFYIQEEQYKRFIRSLQKDIKQYQSHKIASRNDNDNGDDQFCQHSNTKMDYQYGYQELDHRVIGQRSLDVHNDIYTANLKTLKNKYFNELNIKQIQINDLENKLQNMKTSQLEKQIKQLQQTIKCFEVESNQKDQRLINIEMICKQQQEKLVEIEQKLKEYTVRPACESEIEYIDYQKSGDIFSQLVDYQNGKLKDKVKTITLTFTNEISVYRDLVQSEIDYSVTLFLNILLKYIDCKIAQQKGTDLDRFIGLQELVRCNNDMDKKHRVKDLLKIIQMGNQKVMELEQWGNQSNGNRN